MTASIWLRLSEAGLVRSNVDLAPLTTYKLGGPARWYAEPGSTVDLTRLAEAIQAEPCPVLVLGRGSNLVISDSGYPGLVLRLGRRFAQITPEGEEVLAGGLAALPQVARIITSTGRRNLEFMIGVPGTVGGGVRQNAGCFGSDIDDVLIEARVFDLSDGSDVLRARSQLEFGYRQSSIAPTQVVVEARFATAPGNSAAGLRQIKEYTRWRRDHQPGGTLNAGSVFKNPPGDSAGRLIDSLGLKGTSVGGASVSEKHANFFVALPGTKAIDVYLLVEQVAAKVEAETGVTLEPEIQFAGNFGEEEKTR